MFIQEGSLRQKVTDTKWDTFCHLFSSLFVTLKNEEIRQKCTCRISFFPSYDIIVKLLYTYVKYYRDFLCMCDQNCVEIQRLSRLRIGMQICFRKLAGIYRVLRTVLSNRIPAKWLEHIFPKRVSLSSFRAARGLQLAYVLHFVIYVAWFFLHASSRTHVRARSPLFHPFQGLLCSTCTTNRPSSSDASPNPYHCSTSCSTHSSIHSIFHSVPLPEPRWSINVNQDFHREVELTRPYICLFREN